MVVDLLALLGRKGIRPTPQRLAVAEAVLGTRAHPSAEQVLALVRQRCPTVSRATVYNTLNLMVEKGLIRQQVLREGTTIFDAHVDPHHHLIDEDTGQIHDVPWEAVGVTGADHLDEFEVRDLQVVMRGRRRAK
jgi:Fe2+ or Zn2+ uptake regulation protein